MWTCYYHVSLLLMINKTEPCSTPTVLPLTSAAQQLFILESECHFGRKLFPERGVDLGWNKQGYFLLPNHRTEFNIINKQYNLLCTIEEEFVLLFGRTLYLYSKVCRRKMVFCLHCANKNMMFLHCPWPFKNIHVHHINLHLYQPHTSIYISQREKANLLLFLEPALRTQVLEDSMFFLKVRYFWSEVTGKVFVSSTL